MISGIATLGYVIGLFFSVVLLAAVLLALYFVIRAAVLSALRTHRAEVAGEYNRSPQSPQSPQSPR